MKIEDNPYKWFQEVQNKEKIIPTTHNYLQLIFFLHSIYVDIYSRLLK